jgi:pyridoxal/pyridoxine/pyridoxamine kinase
MEGEILAKNVAVFNDISGYGKCSLTAAIPVLSVLGSTPHPIVTEVLTGQGGYAVRYSRDLTDMLPEYIKAWKDNKATFEAIYSGYLTGDKQIDYVLEFIDEFAKEDTFVLIDPVMGDNGKVYKTFSKELLCKMRELTKRAHLITPNITEACLLAGIDYDEICNIIDAQELVGIIESGINDNNIDKECVSKIKAILKDAKDADFDTLILGCTHFPRLEKTISEITGKKTVSSALMGAFEIIKYCTPKENGRLLLL